MSTLDRTNIYEESKKENRIKDAEKKAQGKETPQEGVDPSLPDAVSEERLRQNIDLINPDENSLDRG